MNRYIDKLGRIVIPKEMRKQLGINEYDPLNIELQGNKIIITKPDEIDYKAIVEKAREYIKKYLLECEVYGEVELNVIDFENILNGNKD